MLACGIPLWGNMGISESPQLSTATALSLQRGEDYQRWEISLCYGLGLAALGSELKWGAGLPAEKLISFITKHLHSADRLCSISTVS